MDSAFTGSVPQLYERHLVPLIFEPYADDLVRRLAAHSGLTQVLELAAGTGAVTRRMAQVLPPSVAIVATDLNPAMLEQAGKLGTSRPVEWQQADAMKLPFDDQSFDAVVCQFGVMFFPDKGAALAEARRVLKPGGVLLFNVWDRLEDNEVAEEASNALAAVFPADPPRFLPRTPYGYFDHAAIVRDVKAGGFSGATLDTVTARSKADSAKSVAIGYVQGTPLRGEVDARDASKLSDATDAVEKAIAKRFGDGAIDGKIQAIVVTAQR